MFWYLYTLSVSSFLVFPALGYALVDKEIISFKKHRIWLVPLLVMLCIHSLFQFFDYSIAGDIIDHTLWSIKFFYFYLLLFLLAKSESIISNILRGFSIMLVMGSLPVGFASIYLFVVPAQWNTTDKHYEFRYEENNYETRRYVSDFVTLSDISYRYSTYQVFTLWLFEKHIDSTTFRKSKHQIAFQDEQLQINIIDNAGYHILRFSSPNGKAFSKKISLD